MSKLNITETVLRDGNQSLIATRLKTEDMIPILDKMDKVGYHSMEVWGGATFDACLRYLNEDPWERLRKIRKKVKNTKLQMLLRGQNLLGYKHYPDDVVEKFIQKSVKNGIDIIRIFDALNDTRNLKTSIDAIKKTGAHCQCAISYTTSKIHNVSYYINLITELEEMGADSICIKDMAGILLPDVAYNLIKKAKEKINIPIQLHTHCTSGIASMTYMKAIEAGVDTIDTSISPFSLGTSQPPTECLALSMENSERSTGLNIKYLGEIAEYFKNIKEEYVNKGILNSKIMEVEPKTLSYQVPGGMLSNLLSQLKAQEAESKFEDVLKEIPKVREDLGYPPLVTPLSQMVGTQAVFNVLTGGRYKIVPKEIKDYVKGLYGKSPAPINENIRKKIIREDKGITVRPADLIEPELEKVKKESKSFCKSTEDTLSYVLFPSIAKDFLQKKYIDYRYIDVIT